METDKYYIEVYNKMGSHYWGKGDDQQLKEWGNSEEEIHNMKIDCVKSKLKWYSDGIQIYKMLNEMCGGKNIL